MMFWVHWSYFITYQIKDLKMEIIKLWTYSWIWRLTLALLGLICERVNIVQVSGEKLIQN